MKYALMESPPVPLHAIDSALVASMHKELREQRERIEELEKTIEDSKPDTKSYWREVVNASNG